jgi:hypothetical protein
MHEVARAVALDMQRLVEVAAARGIDRDQRDVGRVGVG